MNTIKFLAVALLVIGFAGCMHAPKIIVKPFTEPQYGMTKLEMLDLLGTPEKIEIYKKTDLTRVEFYFYMRQYQSSHDTVPVCLIDNKIVGWGKAYYEDHVSSDDTKIK